MQFSPKGGNEMAQVSSDDAKRAKSAGKTRCQACVCLSTEGKNKYSITVRLLQGRRLTDARTSCIIELVS